MKILITLKDPDGFSDCVQDAVKESLAEMYESDPDEADACYELRTEKVWDQLNRFVMYQEYVTIEFDTDTGTATVLRNRAE